MWSACQRAYDRFNQWFESTRLKSAGAAIEAAVPRRAARSVPFRKTEIDIGRSRMVFAHRKARGGISRG